MNQANHTQPDWLNEAPLRQLLQAIADAGGEARVVGGAVRDHLLGITGGDVDVASTLSPEHVMNIAAKQGWKAIPTGIAHGTVTLVLPTRVVEVTTLRRDVTTDGRHATVAFTEDWREDASRRDFTINALSMDAAGKIYDYFAGQADITAHRVRFIGDAATRIAEDGLRMLRFFRFLASVGKPPADDAALAAIGEKKSMIATLSGERVANEMKKLLNAHNPAYALRLMQSTGTAALVFGQAIEPATMIRLQMLEGQAGYQTSVWARALGLLPHASEAEAGSIITRWKLSRQEAAQLTLLAKLPTVEATAPRHVHTRILRLHGAPAYLDWLLVHAARTAGIAIAPYVHLAHDFKPPIFPLTAKDLLARGMKEGKALGDALAAMEQRWEQSDYTLTKEALLEP